MGRARIERERGGVVDDKVRGMCLESNDVTTDVAANCVLCQIPKQLSATNHKRGLQDVS